MAKMFFKTFILLLTFVVGAVHSIHDPAYTGIKTKSYQSDPQIAKALEQQRNSFRANQYPEQTASSSSSYQPTKTINTDEIAIDEGLSQVSNNNNNNNRYNTQYDHDDADDFSHHVLPIYERNFQERHAASSNWDDAENTITEYYTGCPSDHTGQLPYAYDCRRFLNCWKGRGHIQSCAPGTVFDPKNLECDRPDKVVCGAMEQVASIPLAPLRTAKSANYQHSGRSLDENVEQVPVLCPSGVTGLHPHPTDCTKFINCDNGNVHVQSCGPGTAYDAKMMICDFIHKVDCSSRQAGQSGAQAGIGHGYRDRPADYANSRTSPDNAAVVCPHDAAGLYHHPYDCSKFLNCANGITHIQDCGPGTAFDSINRVCDYKAKVHCGTGNDHGNVGGGSEIANSYEVTNSGFSSNSREGRKESRSSNIFCPAGVDGLFAYPFDYKKFLECSNGNTAIQNCRRETVFSISKRFCDSKSKVQTFDHVFYIFTDLTYDYSQTIEMCPLTMNGLHLYPYDCSKYISCNNGQMSLVSCAPGTVFSLQRKSCISQQEVEIWDRVQHEMEWRSISRSYSTQGSYARTQNASGVVLSCPSPNGFYIYPFDCAKYFRCQDGNIILKTCEVGSVFNFARKHCDLRENVVENERVAYGTSYEQNFAMQTINGNTQSATFTAVGYLRCPAAAVGLYLHPFDCSAFIRCTRGVTQLEYCPSGSVFSISKKYCVTRDQVDAYDRVEYNTKISHEFSESNTVNVNQIYNGETVRCPSNLNGRLHHPNDCAKYLECSYGQMTIKSCAPGIVFSMSEKICDLPQNVDATDRSSSACSATEFGNNGEVNYLYDFTTSSYFSTTITSLATDNTRINCPRFANGNYPHPYDYKKFLNCANGRTRIHSCFPNMVFSNSRKTCDLERNVDVSDRGPYDVSGAGSGSNGIYDNGQSTTSTTNSGLCPPGSNGVTFHPHDCTKFLNCANGVTHINNCGTGTAWNNEKQSCDFIHKVNCTGRHASLNQYASTRTTEINYYGSGHNSAVVSCPVGVTGRFPHPFDCSKYINCLDGKKIIQNCIAGTVYSISKKFCELKERVPKTDRVSFVQEYGHELMSETENGFSQTALDPEDISCPAGATGSYLHPFDPTLYLKCENERAVVYACMEGMVFSISRKLCFIREQVESTDQITYLIYTEYNPSNRQSKYNSQVTSSSAISDGSYVTCPPGAGGLLPHPYDCKKFLNCANGATHILDCGNGTAWDIKLKLCDFEDKVDCTNREIYARGGGYGNGATAATAAQCPAGQYGVYPHPFDCTKYLNCDNGRTHIQDCAPGTAWSSTMEVCDFIDKVDCSGRNGINTGTLSSSSSSSTSSTSDGTTNTQVDYEYSHSNRDGKSHSNAGSRVNNWDQQPTGSSDQSWNYQQQQHGYRPQTGYGSSSTATTTTTNHQQGGDRWSNMHMSRPNPSASYNPATTHYYAGSDTEGQQQVNTNWDATGSRPGVVQNPAEQGLYSSWSGTGSSTSQQSPTHTVIYEEGSLQPNSNYPQIVRKYSTPLAPISPITTTTTTTTPTIYYYAQPVGSQEDTEETFTDIAGGDLSPSRPTVNHQPSVPTYHSNRPQHGRDLSQPGVSNSWDPNVHTLANAPNYPQQYPIPVLPKPNQNLMPPYPNNTKQTTPLYSYNDHRTPTYRQPPTDNAMSETVGIPVSRLMPPHREYVPRQHTPNVTNNNLDNLPGTPYVLNTSSPYGGPPTHFGTPAQSSPNYNTDQQAPIYENDEANLYGGLQPPFQTPTEPTTTPNPFLSYPTHPTTPIQPSPLNDYDKPESKAHVYQIYPPIKNVPVQRYPNEPHYSSPYSGVAHSQNTSWPNTGIKSPRPPQSYTTSSTISSNPSNQDTTDSRTPVNYNRQYYKPAITPTDPQNSNDMAMQQLPISQALRMLLRPYFNRSGTVDDEVAARAESHIMNLASKSHTNPITPTSTTTTTRTITTTKRPNAFDMDGNEKDVELIFAGEQHSLVEVEVPVKSGGGTTTNTVHTDFHASGHNWQTTGQGSSSQSPHENSNWHKREFHQNHPNVPNPFNGDERSSSANPHRNWHNHPHDHHHNHEHNRDFHSRHPNIPNPFETTTSVNNSEDPEYIPNPWAESTTPKNLYSGGFDNNACPFNCGNGKCVQEAEICDGVNNCGNRKDESECDRLGYEVRLAGGDASNLGRVEVKVLGKWGYVCDDKFGLRDADVVCKELGFKLGASEVRGNSFWAPTETNISFVMDEVECEGNEVSLKECKHKGWGVNNCRMDEIVGVVCKVPLLKCPNNYWLCSTSKECIPPAFVCDNTPDCTDKSDESAEVCNSPIAYRLEGGRSSNEGRLEVMYRNVWGTVCDDDFGLNEAKVLCYSLGFYGTPKIEKNIYGPGSGPIWLDQVACLGNETSLDKCNHWTWGEHNCNHTEDVGIKCTVGPPPRRTQSGSGPLQGGAAAENTPQSEEQFATTLEDIGVYSGQYQRSSKQLPDSNQKRCGHFKNDIVDEYEHPEERVVNGTAAKRGHHPWQATIRTKGRGGISSHWCGAVLISKKHLLTAAHCLVGYPKGAYFIRTGDHYANIAEASETDSYIENWYIHENFRDSTHMNNDIALIVLKHPVRFSDYIQPICLPEKGASLQVNRMCTISGWGSIKSGVSTPSNILRSAQLPILSDQTCKQAHVYGTSMTEGMFCAGSMDESVDACDGDSGGPLVCSDEDAETLYGIISWGQQCGFANKPGVYVRVEKYIDWIYEKINFSLQQGSN